MAAVGILTVTGIGGIAAGALVGLANGLVITALNVNPFITTLGTMVLIRGVVFLLTGGKKDCAYTPIHTIMTMSGITAVHSRRLRSSTWARTSGFTSP